MTKQQLRDWSREAAQALDRASTRYLVGSLYRLEMIMPSVVVRFGNRTGRRRLATLRSCRQVLKDRDP